jgi:zinc protease
MKRILLSIAVLMAVAAVTAGRAPLAAQTPALPTVDQVLEKYVAAIGGRVALEKITSVHLQGTLEIPDFQINGTVEIMQKAPNKVVQIVTLANMGVQREGFDGTIAWAEDPQTGIREKAGAELADAKRGALFPRELKLNQQYPTMTVTGRERVGERDAIVIQATPAEGAPAKLYFDATTSLLLRQSGTRNTPEGPIAVEVTLEDYRDINGIKRPHVIRQTTPQFAATIRLTSFKDNETFDDAIFKKPAK